MWTNGVYVDVYMWLETRQVSYMDRESEGEKYLDILLHTETCGPFYWQISTETALNMMLTVAPFTNMV